MRRGVAVFCLVLVSLVGLASVAQEFTDLVCQADAAFDRWGTPFEFDAYQAKLETAISLWEQALPLVPTDDRATTAHVLNHMAEAYFEMGEAYLFAPAEREAAYDKGRTYALASLRLDPTFGTTEASNGFRAALLSATDVAAIFWYGNNVGQWYNFHQIEAILGGVLDVLASYERAAELDETYMGGGPRRSLAALIAQAYFVLGKSREESVPHYERSIEIDPDYLESYVNYAQYYALSAGQDDLAARLLRTLDQKATDPMVVAKWPLYNTLAIRRANSLPR
jgi:tetratricopeptide (TPR) repeat protein